MFVNVQAVVFPVSDPSRVTFAPVGVEVMEISPVVGATDVVVVVFPLLFFVSRTAATIPATANPPTTSQGNFPFFSPGALPPFARRWIAASPRP